MKKARFLSRVSKKKKIHESDEGEFFGRIEEKQKKRKKKTWMKQIRKVTVKSFRHSNQKMLQPSVREVRNAAWQTCRLAARQGEEMLQKLPLEWRKA